jgi:hypothetical protein
MEFWNIDILKVLGGCLGKFIDKEDFNMKVDKRVVKILAAMDMWEGLAEYCGGIGNSPKS